MRVKWKGILIGQGGFLSSSGSSRVKVLGCVGSGLGEGEEAWASLLGLRFVSVMMALGVGAVGVVGGSRQSSTERSRNEIRE